VGKWLKINNTTTPKGIVQEPGNTIFLEGFEHWGISKVKQQ